MELFSYDNPSSAECDGDHCEGLLGGTCDNQFDFCVRTVGSSQCLVTLSSDEIEDDSLTFTIDELDDLSISNPLRFTSIATTVSSVCMCVFMFMYIICECELCVCVCVLM